MITRYSKFLNENLNKSKSILKSKMDDYEKMKNLLTSKNALGYMGKFTEFLFNGVPYSEIETLYNNIADLKKRNLKIDIDSFNKYEDVLDEIAKKEITYKFRSIFNQFPKEQKELFDEPKDMDREDIITISKLYDIEDYKPFMNKISRYKSEYELTRAIKRFISGKMKSLTRDDIKGMLDDDLILKFENENIMILQTLTHDSIVKVGSDTSWCIVNSASTFRSYTSKGQTQYVIIDFNKDQFDTDHKIGFTLSKDNKILYAHDILDKSIIPHTVSLLQKNKVDLNKINVAPEVDLSNFGKMTKLSEIEKALEDFGYNNVELNQKLISILVYKLSRTKSGYEIKRNLENIFQNQYKIKGSMLTIDEFNVYKSSLGDFYDEIENYMSSNGYLLSNKTPGYIFRSPEILLANYKNWKYKLTESEDYYIDQVKRENGYAEPIKYYASQSPSKYQLLIMYCDKVLGEEINIEDIKTKIDSLFTKSKESIRYKYYNYFGIKYYYDQDLSDNMDKDYIIPSKVTLKDTFWNRQFELLENCDVTVEYTKSFIEESVNSGFKLVNSGKNNDVARITRRADNMYDHTNDWKNHNELRNIILESMINLMGANSRKIVIRDDVHLPTSYKFNINMNTRNNKLSMEITIIITK